jgi:hypothetical protein
MVVDHDAVKRDALAIVFQGVRDFIAGGFPGPVTTSLGYTTSHPPCRGIWDFSGVTEFEVSNAAMRQAAVRRPIIASGYMRVIVASQDFLFGMMRMLQLLSEEDRPELLVVRTMDEAYRWLLVDAPDFTPVGGGSGGGRTDGANLCYRMIATLISALRAKPPIVSGVTLRALQLPYSALASFRMRGTIPTNRLPISALQ